MDQPEAPSVGPLGDISTALILKRGALFLVTDRSGGIPPQTGPDGEYGLGLYFHDTRHLDQVALRLNGVDPTPLLASTDLGYEGVCGLTNPEIIGGAGDGVGKDLIGIRWERTIEGGLRERLTLENYDRAPHELTLTLDYDAHFDDIFLIRGFARVAPRVARVASVEAGALIFRYDGADGHRRTTTVRFDPPASDLGERRATFRFRLVAGEARTFRIAIDVADEAPPVAGEALGRGGVPAPPTGAPGSLADEVRVTTSNALFNQVLRRSFLDLAMLATEQGGHRFFAAGLPWFACLFGRDSLIAALEALPYDPSVARSTLAVLARRQGQREDDWRDEEPGKILHELRVGELTNLGEVPFGPYFGTIDATPLFLILLGEYLRWTGDLAFFAELREAVEAALTWLDRWGDRDGDGFVEYASRSGRGLAHQGWKDSNNAIVNEDGTIVDAPVALAEVQGYAYRARRQMAEAFRLIGDEGRAATLDAQAASLRAAFNDQFWLPTRGTFAQALQGTPDAAGRKRPAAVDASNQGQALWGGVVYEDKADAIRDALLDPARLFAGWGIRTLSRSATAYNPFDYQTGAVWPHDSALIGDGLRRYGFDGEALTILTGLFQAATHFEHYRLPELWAGFGWEEFATPLHYAAACSPQAWAAGSIPFLLSSILGLAPDASAQRLTIARPRLPEWLDWVEMTGLRVGAGEVDLRFERAGALTLALVTRKSGDLAVTIEC